MPVHVNVVQLHVRAECLPAFLDAVRANHEASVREPGNLRFDVLRSAEDPTRFVLYEVYASAEAAAAHRETAHFVRWRETVEPLYASPRVGMVCEALHPAPEAPEAWGR